jgi:large subunit ribosomal protein L15
MKKRRGAGSRGGRGKAGSGKRGDSQKPSYWKLTKGRAYLGKYGFTSIKDKDSVLNVSDLQDQLSSLVENDFASQKKDEYTIDAKKIGIDKLLGSGKITVPVHVTVKSASDSAIRKIEEAGGSVTVSKEE